MKIKMIVCHKKAGSSLDGLAEEEIAFLIL